ncbi:hypothetical protein IIA79_06225 [bacterium]|nr:hypothetical protein [bacterium]
MIPAQKVAEAFSQAYGSQPRAVAWAPGRVNLIGEHIDYAGGSVLPVSLSQGVACATGLADEAAARSEQREPYFAICSDQFADAGVVHFKLDETPASSFARLSQVIAKTIGATGANVAVCADLALGRGCASSAAFSVALAAALHALGRAGVTPSISAIELCRLCQRAEGEALGVACGLMDQYAAVFGRADSAVLFDSRRISHEYVPLDLGEAALVLVDSRQGRQLAESGYNRRRTELSEAFAELHRRLGWTVEPGAGTFSTSWRDIPRQVLEAGLDSLDGLPQRRLRHVITEQQRVESFAARLKLGDAAAMGRLLNESQASLRDNYEVSTAELDLLCELLLSEAGVLGARLTGGGFGGSVLALAERSVLPASLDSAVCAFRQETGLEASWQEVVPGDGAAVRLGATPPMLLREWLA